MPPPSISRLRALVRALRYFVSLHAAEEMEDDAVSVFDVENIILAGHIVERQRDRETNEIKILIRGATLDRRQAEAVVKVGPSGSLYIITVYLL